MNNMNLEVLKGDVIRVKLDILIDGDNVRQELIFNDSYSSNLLFEHKGVEYVLDGDLDSLDGYLASDSPIRRLFLTMYQEKDLELMCANYPTMFNPSKKGYEFSSVAVRYLNNVNEELTQNP
jgi:hypothetical protein